MSRSPLIVIAMPVVGLDDEGKAADDDGSEKAERDVQLEVLFGGFDGTRLFHGRFS